METHSRSFKLNCYQLTNWPLCNHCNVLLLANSNLDHIFYRFRDTVTKTPEKILPTPASFDGGPGRTDPENCCMKFSVKKLHSLVYPTVNSQSFYYQLFRHCPKNC